MPIEKQCEKGVIFEGRHFLRGAAKPLERDVGALFNGALAG